MTKRKNLLIVCCGDNSLHNLWFSEARSYDILTIYYGDDAEVAEKYRANSEFFFADKGIKIELARKVLLEHLYFKEKFIFSDYELIWFPDDDLIFPETGPKIENLYETARAMRADVFQPAILNENFSIMWESTRKVDGAFAHRTNIVEVMAHGFSGEIFEKAYLPAIHICEFMKSGWGIEPIWLKIGESALRRSLRTFVVDAVPIIHTRPVGAGLSRVHMQGSYEATYIPQIYTNRMATEKIYNDISELVNEPEIDVHVDHEKIDAYHANLFEEFLQKEN